MARDIAQLQAMLERQSTAFRAVFDVDPTFVQVVVEHDDPVADARNQLEPRMKEK